MRLRPVVLAFVSFLVVTAPAPAQEPLTVYSSLPLQGASRPQALGVIRGARLALQRAGGQAAGRPVRYVSLDDSGAQVGAWMPERVSANARRAARDASAVGYLGELNSGASAISMPILNEAGILQVSPSNTAVGLTVDGPGADRGEPDRYYPTITRHFGRIVPHDAVQGRAGAALLQQLGAKRVLVLHDREVYGRGVARHAARSLRARGIRVTRFLGIDRKAPTYRGLARLARRADAVYYGGITANNAVQLWNDISRRNPRLVKVGSDGVAESGFTDRQEGGVSSRAARRTYVTLATLAPQAYPPAGQEVFAALGGTRDPYAIYGFEAMALILDAVNRGGGTRAGAVRALFETRDRDSVLGRYSITPTGDTTLTQYGVYRIRRGALVFDRAVDAGP